MPDLPSPGEFDAALPFLREGYCYGSRRFERLGTQCFRTRLLGRPTVFVRGAAAARAFYAADAFTRRQALPPTVLVLLQDRGSVQQLDGAAHRERKAGFNRLLGPQAIADIVQRFHAAADAAMPRWTAAPRLVMHEEFERLLTVAACGWVGIDLRREDEQGWQRAIGGMIDGAGSFGPRWVRGWVQRNRVERWMRDAISRVRGTPQAVSTPVGAIAGWRDDAGALLDVRTAGVELLNLARPIVAVARWMTFAAVALHEHPAAAGTLRAGTPGDPATIASAGDASQARHGAPASVGDASPARRGETPIPPTAPAEALRRFALEVRRFYPFFPVVGGRALRAVDLCGHRVDPGAMVMLDLYGTCHDPGAWDAPAQFDPTRFTGLEDGAEALIPQGAGAVQMGHRCPGEQMSIALLEAAIDLLANRIGYRVPVQDLGYSMTRMPSIPRSRVIVEQVRARV